MRILYIIFFYAALPFIFFRLWWRSLRLPRYRYRAQERLGYIKPLDTDLSIIWVHAVSLGEVIAAIPLVEALILNYPNWQVFITTTTLTGSDQVHRHFKGRVRHSYFPYDLPGTIRRFLKRAHPELIILMETELWPNLLHITKRQRIPVLLVNARLSQNALRGYRWVGRWFQRACANIECVAAQSVEDGQRFLKLGLDASQVVMTGNIKFDLSISTVIKQDANVLRASWGKRPVWVAASTHDGEEIQILQALKIIKKRYPDVLLILVPRHPERFEKVGHLCEENYFHFIKRSLREVSISTTDILLGDTLGELRLLYAASDIAFIGGSLVPIGGHNMIEAAALRLPIITGPYLDNFREVSRLLEKEEALLIVDDANKLADTVLSLLDKPAYRDRMGNCAYRVSTANTGALERTLQRVATCINKKG